MSEELVRKSTLVVAHPDDEILWFSSVLDDVGQIIFCYRDVTGNATCSSGRAKALAEYPFKKMISLNITESNAFGKSVWEKGKMNEWGLRLNRMDSGSELYEKNFYTLRGFLGEKLVGCKNIITHNPWGEYGHEEHVQVYRVVESLQYELGFEIWFSNYVSTKSLYVFGKYLNDLDSQYMERTTDPSLADSIVGIYQKHNCWTWYNDWQWPANEALLKMGTEKSANQNRVFNLPINFLKLKEETKKKKSRNYLGTSLRGRINRIQNMWRRKVWST